MIHNGTFGKHVRNCGDSAVNPFHKGRVVCGLIHGIAVQRQAGYGIILRQQVNNLRFVADRTEVRCQWSGKCPWTGFSTPPTMSLHSRW